MGSIPVGTHIFSLTHTCVIMISSLFTFQIYSWGLVTTTSTAHVFDTIKINWYTMLLQNHVRSMAKTSSFKQMIFRIHSIVNKILKRQSYSAAASGLKICSIQVNYLRGHQASCLKLYWNQISQSVTNHRGGLKTLLFYSQSEKSPDSGLRADDLWNNCIRHYFFLLPLAVNKRMPHCMLYYGEIW